MKGFQQRHFKKQRLIHDLVVRRTLERSTTPEQGLLIQCFQEEIRIARQIAGIQAEYAQAHAAADIHPYPIGNHGVCHGEYATDGQSVPTVSVGHNRPGHADGQACGLIHLMERRGLDMLPPEDAKLDSLAVGRRVSKYRLGCFRSLFRCQGPPHGVVAVCARVFYELLQKLQCDASRLEPIVFLHQCQSLGSHRAIREAHFTECFCSNF